MALDLSSIATEEKNKTISNSVFIVLLKVQLPSTGTPVYFCANTENIIWDGHTWIATAFDIDEIGENTTSDAPEFSIKINNVNRIMESYIQQYDTWLKSNVHEAIGVTLYVVNSLNLAEPLPELEYSADVLSYTTDAMWATFRLGSENLLNYTFPKDMYTANACRFVFKSAECSYSGPETLCRKTLTACEAYNNSQRFGAFPSIDSKIKHVQLD